MRRAIKPKYDSPVDCDVCPQCGKISYPTRQKAQVALDGIYSRGSWGAKGMSAYKCPFCKLWHISHGRQKRIGKLAKHKTF